ncbi:MAG TPA: hypothetical protein VG055_11555 [Planctomycetaceae bacterium]|jgi:hypothetical protein|nr:hypothetical protein [Planctomycetaceae bacterium]
MPDELIPSPAETPNEKTSKKRTSKHQNRPTGDEEPERPKARHRRAPQMPSPAELVDQLQQVSGLVTLGLLTPAKANSVIRCISTSSHIVMRCQTATPGAPNQPELVEACRDNPKLIALLESLLTDDQLAELLREVNDDEA